MKYMKNCGTKKNVLFLSLFGVSFFLSPVIFYWIFDCYSRDIFLCSAPYQNIAMLFVLFVPTLLFSLITYHMRQEVFDHWMKFAIWATPLLMVLTFLINGGGNNGLGVEGVIGGGFDVMLYMIFYGLYVGISLWRILSKYHAMKDK